VACLRSVQGCRLLFGGCWKRLGLLPLLLPPQQRLQQQRCWKIAAFVAVSARMKAYCYVNMHTDYVCACWFVRVRVRVRMCVLVPVCVRVHVHVCVRGFACLRVRACVRACVCGCVRERLRDCLLECVHACLCACVHVCMNKLRPYNQDRSRRTFTLVVRDEGCATLDTGWLAPHPIRPPSDDVEPYMLKRTHPEKQKNNMNFFTRFKGSDIFRENFFLLPTLQTLFAIRLYSRSNSYQLRHQWLACLL